MDDLFELAIILLSFLMFFILRNSISYANDYKVFNDLTKDTLDELVLQKRDKVWESDGYQINYELEDSHRKTLRKLYQEPKADGSLD